MNIRKIRLKNWMNFKAAEVGNMQDRVFIIGPNASGKSNLLDALRFLRDVARPAGVKPSGGGLQKAVDDRGGISKLRCLNAKSDNEVQIYVELENVNEKWTYDLGFKGEGQANNRIIIVREMVHHDRHLIINRPNSADEADRDQLTQTHLELTNANKEFRILSHFFSEITYLHLVPQLLKFGDQIGGNVIEQDPFGQGFLQRISGTNQKTRDAKLRRILEALKYVVPQFRDLRFEKDEKTGAPHLAAKFEHWRPQGAWQRENQFSDGTLRLIGLLWSLTETSSLLLLEEPELSLNEDIVRSIPKIIARIQKQAKTGRQVMVTTHSEALLESRSIPASEVIRLEPTSEGTRVVPPSEQEEVMLKSGLPVGQVLLPATRPEGIKQLELSLE